MGEIFGALLMPLFIIFFLFMMAGAKSDVLVKALVDIMVCLVKAGATLIAMVLRAVCEFGMMLLVMKRLNAQNQMQSMPVSRPARSKVKVVVVDEDE